LPSTSAVCAFQRNCECPISANTYHFYSHTPPMPCNPMQLSKSCKKYHGPSTDLHHESGNSALPDMSGLVDQSGASVWNRGTGAA
ncbi:hypothetical protein T01_13459, partial [Trichinella spiralis]